MILSLSYIITITFYITQFLAQVAAKRHTKLISQLKHPGYSLEHDDLCQFYAKNILSQQSRYVVSMLDSKICFVGTAQQKIDVCKEVGWTVRKYTEAMAAGCVVIGDVPGIPPNL
jgi:hypothetical protein